MDMGRPACINVRICDVRHTDLNRVRVTSTPLRSSSNPCGSAYAWFGPAGAGRSDTSLRDVLSSGSGYVQHHHEAILSGRYRCLVVAVVALDEPESGRTTNSRDVFRSIGPCLCRHRLCWLSTTRSAEVFCHETRRPGRAAPPFRPHRSGRNSSTMRPLSRLDDKRSRRGAVPALLGHRSWASCPSRSLLRSSPGAIWYVIFRQSSELRRVTNTESMIRIRG